MSRNRDLQVLGQDDWLVFARTATGVLVYTVIETDWHWLEAPHEGLAGHGSPEWREDNQFMHDWVSGRAGDYDWQVYDIEPWPREEDDAFVNQSAANYLPRKEERSVRRWPWPRPDSVPRRRVRRVRHVLVELTLVGSQILYQVARLNLGKTVSGRGKVGAQRGPRGGCRLGPAPCRNTALGSARNAEATVHVLVEGVPPSHQITPLRDDPGWYRFRAHRPSR